MANEKKDRTHRLGRVHAEVYTTFRSKADGNLSDTTVFSDLLAHLAGLPNRAEKLEAYQIGTMLDPDVLRNLADIAEAIREGRIRPDQQGQAELISEAELISTEAGGDELYARAS